MRLGALDCLSALVFASLGIIQVGGPQSTSGSQTGQQQPPPAPRANARLSSVPRHVLLPHRNSVLYALRCALDDHKRVVRTAAARARGLWFALAEGGGPDE